MQIRTKQSIFLYIIVCWIARSSSKFIIHMKSPLLLEEQFKDGKLPNHQILEGSEKFHFEEIMNIVSLNGNGCSQFDESTSITNLIKRRTKRKTSF
jgi:hypothetical protein